MTSTSEPGEPDTGSALTADPGPTQRPRSALAPLPFMLLLAVQLVALYWPRVAVEHPFSWADKAAHVLIFAAPAAAGVLARLRPAYVLGLLAVHAPVSEVVQHDVLPHRTGDPLDALADLVGVGLGGAVGVVWARLRRW